MNQPKEREFAFDNKDFKFISDLIYDQTGIVLAKHKHNMVYSRLVRRLRKLSIKDFKGYCAYLEHNIDVELVDLVNAITTNLTAFFREPHHFEHLHDEVLCPLLATNPAQKRLRIWSAGCSSGAEPYTIAMTLASAMKGKKGWDAKILATDIDTNMLDTGSAGIYRGDMATNIPDKYNRFYKENGDEILMSKKLKSYISFKRLNLLESWPFKGPFDAIFCRNVVIYFDKDTQRTLFERYANMIKPDGWLYIGHSENLFHVCDRFESLGKTIYKRVK
jgi:chemotaxis protein methyltransferase CheR